MTEIPPSPQTALPPPDAAPQPKKLYRNTQNAMVGGVASGLAEYFGVDVTVARVATVLVMIFSFFTGVIAYLAMWLVIPPKPQ